jgi:hypothetical protein
MKGCCRQAHRSRPASLSACRCGASAPLAAPSEAHALQFLSVRLGYEVALKARPGSSRP